MAVMIRNKDMLLRYARAGRCLYGYTLKRTNKWNAMTPKLIDREGVNKNNIQAIERIIIYIMKMR